MAQRNDTLYHAVNVEYRLGAGRGSKLRYKILARISFVGFSLKEVRCNVRLEIVAVVTVKIT